MDFPEKLPEPLGRFLLASRCFGRATPFPHALMQRVLAGLTELSYSDVTKELRSRKLIVSVGKVAFDLSHSGKRYLRLQIPDPAIWKAALDAMIQTVPATIAAKDMDALDLLHIHAAGLGNAFYTQRPQLYFYLMGLSVQCLQALGRNDDAQTRLRSMQRVLDKLKGRDEA